MAAHSQLAGEDLSAHHQPITDLFPRSASDFRLSADQVTFYRENGYLAGVRMLDDHQIDVLRESLKRLMDPSHPGHKHFYEFHSNESPDPNKVLFHALGAWRIEPAFHDILWNSRFTTAASQLLDGPVRFWHDQLFVKPAHHGGVVAWHQDYSYWTRTKPVAHLTCWIGLDDSTEANGCVHYVPKSHTWPLLPRVGLAGDMEEIKTVLTQEQKRDFKPVPIVLKTGECSFHHSFTLHGSYENKTEIPRRAIVLNVFRDGVISDSDQPPLEGVPSVPAGQKMEGRFFPLLTS